MSYIPAWPPWPTDGTGYPPWGGTYYPYPRPWAPMPPPQAAMQAWICPRCRRVNGPMTMHCDCKPEKAP